MTTGTVEFLTAEIGRLHMKLEEERRTNRLLLATLAAVSDLKTRQLAEQIPSLKGDHHA